MHKYAKEHPLHWTHTGMDTADVALTGKICDFVTHVDCTTTYRATTRATSYYNTMRVSEQVTSSLD